MRFRHQKLRTAHRYFIEALRSGRLDNVLPQVLDRLLTCRSGAPYALAEILLRSYDASAQGREMPICLRARYCPRAEMRQTPDMFLS